MVSTPDNSENGGDRQNIVRDLCRKLVECEERLTFWRKMVKLGIGGREVEHLGDDIREKYRSESYKSGKSHREIIELVMSYKLKDEKRHQKEIKCKRNQEKEIWRTELNCDRKYSRLLSKLNSEARKYRKLEKKKYRNKADHLKRIRESEIERELEVCPSEIKKYERIKIFNKREFNKLKKEDVKVEVIGKVVLDKDERELLKLPPKFAIRKRLNSTAMEVDTEMSMAKIRYQKQKEDLVKDYNEDTEDNNIKRMKLNDNEKEDLETMERLDAESRRIYDPLKRIFDHGKKRVTDLKENSKVNLPKPCDALTESSIELLKCKIMDTFRKYREKNCNERGEQATNLTKQELRGLAKLRKRVSNGSIVVLKTDKSGKLTVMGKDEYEKLGVDKNRNDRIIDRRELRQIEKRINAQTKFWTNILNSGTDHGHKDRILKSKQSESQNSASKYFMYKDHKLEGGYRPVVSGCNSDSLGLSNTLSEVIESVCMAIDKPYEVISSEDMLSRIMRCNEEIERLNVLPIDGSTEWDWRQDYVLLGTDVTALFPSLSAVNTGKAVKSQILKSSIKWENIDKKWLTLYLKLNESNIDEKELSELKRFLPKRISKMGKAPSFGSIKIEEKYSWPKEVDYLTDQIVSKMMGLAMERAVIFFFTHFTYTFGGKLYLQMGGGL